MVVYKDNAESKLYPVSYRLIQTIQTRPENTPSLLRLRKPVDISMDLGDALIFLAPCGSFTVCVSLLLRGVSACAAPS